MAVETIDTPSPSTSFPYFELLAKHMEEASRVGTRPNLLLPPSVSARLELVTTISVKPEIVQSYSNSTLSELSQKEEKKLKLKIIDDWVKQAATDYPLPKSTTWEVVQQTRTDLKEKSEKDPQFTPAYLNSLAAEAVLAKSLILRRLHKKQVWRSRTFAALGIAASVAVYGLGGLALNISSPSVFYAAMGSSVIALPALVVAEISSGHSTSYDKQLKSYNQTLEELHSSLYKPF